MNLQELKEKIEENGLQEAKGYEALFDVTLYDVVKETKKIKPSLQLNAIAYSCGAKKEGQEVVNRFYVVYSFVGAQGFFDVALGFFEVKEYELDDFLDYADKKDVLSVVKLNLANPELVEFVLSDEQRVKFSTLSLTAKNHNSSMVKSIPQLNDGLWRIVEKNYNRLLKEKQQKIVSQIKQRKYINKEIKKDMKRIKGGIRINANILKLNTTIIDGYVFKKAENRNIANDKNTLQKRKEDYAAGKQIIVDLKDRKKELTPKHANKELSFVLGDKK